MAYQLDDGSGQTVTISGPLSPSSSSGFNIGAATTDKVAFYGVTPIVQRVGAAQAAVGTTASTTTTPYGFTTSTQADGIVTLLNECRASLVAIGLIKGAA